MPYFLLPVYIFVEIAVLVTAFQETRRLCGMREIPERCEPRAGGVSITHYSQSSRLPIWWSIQWSQLYGVIL